MKALNKTEIEISNTLKSLILNHKDVTPFLKEVTASVEKGNALKNEPYVEVQRLVGLNNSAGVSGYLIADFKTFKKSTHFDFRFYLNEKNEGLVNDAIFSVLASIRKREEEEEEKREREEKRKREEEERKREEEERKREEEERKREEEREKKIAWINTHGSEYLKSLAAEKFDYEEVYDLELRSHLAKALLSQGWGLTNSRWGLCKTPSAEVLSSFLEIKKELDGYKTEYVLLCSDARGYRVKAKTTFNEIVIKLTKVFNV